MMSEHASLLLLAALVGGAVGLAELLSRYAWGVRPILNSPSGLAYLAINAGVAALSYQAAVDFHLTLGLTGKPEWWRAVAVSVLGMAFFRSAFASIRVGDRDLGIGLVSLVEVFKVRAERQLDQTLTEERLATVAVMVAQLSYEATRSYFESVTLTVLPSLSDVERELIARDLQKVADYEVDGDTKLLLLAMCLQKWLGAKLLARVTQDAATRFKNEIQAEREQRMKRHERLKQLKSQFD